MTIQSVDTRLRSLERRAVQSGSLEDQAAYLRARLKAGQLEHSDCLHMAISEECLFFHSEPCECGRVLCACGGLTGWQRIELAAYLGDQAARLLLPRRHGGTGYRALLSDALTSGDAMQFVADDAVISDEVFMRDLAKWGCVVLVRAARAVIEEPPLPYLCPECGVRGSSAWCQEGCDVARVLSAETQAIRAVDAWIDSPCEENRRACFERYAKGLLPMSFACMLLVVCDESYEAHARDLALSTSNAQEKIARALRSWALRTPEDSQETVE